ncbi:MAG: hypothetical protein J7K40_02580 [candidate division Zixibacteria bacterium]|nr:hypothetical protein [candidate division Zixibacteria bacterium]
MAGLKFTKGTDQEHEETLDSYLISSSWKSACAYAGQQTAFEVRTAFVGDGAKIKIEGKSVNGKKLGKISGVIYSNIYRHKFEIPDNIGLDDEIYFKVDFPDNSINGESNKIPVLPTPKIKKISWSASEARRGDILTLSAELEDARDNTEVKLVIYEYDSDKAHDRIVEVPAVIKSGKIDVKWEYEYHEDTDEIPTKDDMQKYGGKYNPPEYFFTIKFGELELGRSQESKLLKFKDWIEFEFIGDDDAPLANADYTITFADGSEKSGQLDDKGRAKIEDAPPGSYTADIS